MLTPLMQRIKAHYDGRPAFTDALRDVDKLGDRISVADRNVAQFTRSLMSTANIMRGGAFATAITASVLAVNNAAQSVADLAAEAETAGVSFEAFQELKFAAQEKRVGIDALTDGLKELNLRADEFIITKAGPAKEAFERLGYSSEELARKLTEPDRLFGEIIGRLGQLERAAQIRVADEIFGGTAGEQFVRFIKEGEEGIAGMRDRAREAGLVLRDEMGEAAADVAREFDLLMQRWDTWWKGGVLNTAQMVKSVADGASGKWDEDQIAQFYGMDAERWANFKLERALNNQDFANPLEGFASFYGTTDMGAMPLSGALPGFQIGAIPGLPPVRPDDLETNGYEPPKSDRSKEIDQFDKVMEALRHEAELIGKTQVEQDILNQIRRAGVDVMSDEAEQIRQQIIANHELTAAVEAHAKAEAERQQQISDMTNVAMSHFDELIAGTENLGEAIVGTIEDIAMAWLRQQAYQGLNQLFGFMMGGFASASFPSFPMRANGGHVGSDTAYIVGERGPELFVPNSQGVIIPNHRMSDGSASGEININIIGAAGNEEVASLVSQGIQNALKIYDKGTNKRVASAMHHNRMYRING